MIDLSADLGEGAPGEDEVWPLIASANVACGGHVGDPRSMREAVRRAAGLNIKLGAHPSYPDREHFGRQSMTMSDEGLKQTLSEQIMALQQIATVQGVTLQHVKPHGALYNDAHRDPVLAATVIAAIRSVDAELAIVCGATSRMAEAAEKVNVRVIREAFADRRYEANGSLVSRSIAGSLLTIAAATEQAVLLRNEETVIARDGSRIHVPFDTLCVHADLEGAAERLLSIRASLSR
jgi:UPF0271 protein